MSEKTKMFHQICTILEYFIDTFKRNCRASVEYSTLKEAPAPQPRGPLKQRPPHCCLRGVMAD